MLNIIEDGGLCLQTTIYYDSWNTTCKSPFGAVQEHKEITLRLTVDTSLRPKSVALILRRDGEDVGKRLLFVQNVAGNHSITYGITFSVEDAGLYFYRFEIETGSGVLFVGRGEKSCATLGDFLPEWQLTVYQRDFCAPIWPEQGIMYQIFPDRFRKHREDAPRRARNSRILHENWYERPLFTQDDPKYEATDFFGGDLCGIMDKLPYIKSLGITTLYLNPVFEAAANHRYNTGDYLAIDPYLGTMEDFVLLCQEAEKQGISIILDGVFSHTGSDSVYFNKDGHYDSVGAFQSAKSPYASWYQFSEDRTRYECWWGFPTLPNVKETDPQYLDFICGEKGVLSHWMKTGVKGWRLDVADELPDGFLEALRLRVKSENPEAYIVGEVWEDASNKSSYGQRRPYLLGSQLDSVMNYPWRSAVLNFMREGNADAFYESVMSILDHYPQPAVHTLMNFLSTHDTVRAITYLGVDHPVSSEQQGTYQLSAQEYERGKRLFQTASLIQYTLPGFPCLYYGDEAGLSGFADPWNRRCYPWGREDGELIEFFCKLGDIRREFAEAFCGEFYFVAAMDGFIAFVRGAKVLTAVNQGTQDAFVSLKGKRMLAVLGDCALEENCIRIGPSSGAVIEISGNKPI